MEDLKICSIEGCGKKHHAKNYCIQHYRFYKKHKDPLFYNNFKIINLKGEIWKNIEGFEALYAISNLGRFKSLKQIKIKNRNNESFS